MHTNNPNQPIKPTPNEQPLIEKLKLLQEQLGGAALVELPALLSEHPWLLDDPASPQAASTLKLTKNLLGKNAATISLHEAIEHFRASRTVSPATAKNYRLALGHFEDDMTRLLGHAPMLAECTTAACLAWADDLASRPGKAGYKGHQEALARTFLRYCVDPMMWLPEHPFAEEENEHVEPTDRNDGDKRQQRVVWSLKKIIRFLQVAYGHRPDHLPVFATLALVGLPIWLVVKLQYEYFLWAAGELVVPAAVARARTDLHVPLHPHLQEWFTGAPTAGPMTHLRSGGLKKMLGIIRQKAGLQGANGNRLPAKIEMISAISHWVADGVDLSDAVRVRGLGKVKDETVYCVRRSAADGRDFRNLRPAHAGIIPRKDP